jgi:hypothetical protein
MKSPKVIKPQGGGGHRAAAKARRKSYYSGLPPITLTNLKRSRARHIRNFPGDVKAREMFAEKYGEGALTSPACQVRPRMARKHARKTKAKRRHAAILSNP